ncbi:acyl-CoA thioesterase [Pyxidicoccus sp. MSG2]|uniref:acyl-CoA thioesterase n=1 Tax=Pyxidicoccus sp. MSG2 TaxID=2996790 RepID=UPI00227134F7|nr:acyl-CoA thioesterase [Pyxidicoccus sp. MSG2]MCY1021107.1 acyl-CoA thioesterase [Pyxidicoccus sp. MSG2]
MQAFEFKHTVGFEETNLVGNVYYVNHLRWQGRCREMFLREHVPSIIEELGRSLSLVTTRCSCEYLDELRAFDDLLIEMRLGGLSQNRVAMRFDYYRLKDGRRELVARGEQQIACMAKKEEGMVPEPFPLALRKAFEAYAG